MHPLNLHLLKTHLSLLIKIFGVWGRGAGPLGHPCTTPWFSSSRSLIGLTSRPWILFSWRHLHCRGLLWPSNCQGNNFLFHDCHVMLDRSILNCALYNLEFRSSKNDYVFAIFDCDVIVAQLLELTASCHHYQIIKSLREMHPEYHWFTVCGYKFNHMATKLTTLTAFTSASLKGLPVLLEGLLWNKNTNQNTNKEACFWIFELFFFIWILWGFKDRHIKKNCSFGWFSVDFQLQSTDFFSGM